MITVAVSQTSALAAKIETLEAEVNGNIANAFNELKTQVETVDGKVTATASQLTALNATVGQISSNITMRSQVVASPGDNWARYTVQVKTGSNDNWSIGAFYIDVKSNQSRIVMMADQFIIADPNLAFQPFVFANGRLRLQAADIGDVVAGYIHSPDGRFVIDLNGQRITMSD